MYGENAVDDSTCCKWFRKFRANNFNVNNARSGRPAKTDDNEILALIESDRHRTQKISIEKILL